MRPYMNAQGRHPGINEIVHRDPSIQAGRQGGLYSRLSNRLSPYPMSSLDHEMDARRAKDVSQFDIQKNKGLTGVGVLQMLDTGQHYIDRQRWPLPVELALNRERAPMNQTWASDNSGQRQIRRMRQGDHIIAESQRARGQLDRPPFIF